MRDPRELIDREELERLHEAATKGPWEAKDYGEGSRHIRAPTAGYAAIMVQNMGETSDHKPTAKRWSSEMPVNAALIVCLRNAVPDILRIMSEYDALEIEYAEMVTKRDTLSAENARLEEANRTIAAECIKWAREAGEAKGKLEGSEAAGVVDQWREKCEQLEAENAALTAKVERLKEALRAQAQFVDDFFAPWGSWKTAWWEGWVSDHAAFSENNALKALANKARAALKGEEG